ncbi:glycoside hydrolase family 64 protein [Saccharopolyspora sp. K220]|uniref:glycoside hydrolase family 64 protein n=1 Tax=Saccharopolyspora soli TaxID=2926618 RepID=UPI001F569261|nr:glycoside hydrolase family 64 protein [Saccharopolyspora soli]MCI2422217.1 glycoside hydrolase family 64 protein [Saccharopolyspora soli]
MVSRRRFLGYSAAALTAPFWGQAISLPFASAAPENLKFKLVNNSGATAHAYITGLSDGDGRAVFVRPDSTLYFPEASGPEPQPLGEDPAIPVDGTVEVTVARMFGARVYFATNDKLEFQAVKGADGATTVVHPNFVSDADPNFGKDWTFAEFTLNAEQLYANISYVDFVAAPIGLHLQHAGGAQEVPGLPTGSLDKIASSLKGQGGQWPILVQESGGKVVRVLSPNHRAGDFAGYLEPYVDEVYAKYAAETLFIDTQRSDIGILEGKVEGSELVFGSERFAKPTSADIWGCNSGPFANSPGSDSQQRLAIVPRLAAAFNRTTLLINNEQPHSEDPATFYQHEPTNHYARIVHENLPDGKGYAFPYDDVSSNAGEDHSGKVNHSDPEVFTLTLNAIR